MSSSETTVSRWRIPKWFPNLPKETVDHLFTFNSELAKANKNLNLVSAKSIPHADLVHFADSLLSCEAVIKKINKNEVLYDIGGGCGFPGMVFGIVNPDVNVCLIDSDPKRCDFLKSVIVKIGIKNISVSNVLIENLEEGSILQGVCRSPIALTKAFLTLRKAFMAGGSMFFLKTADWPVEVSQIPTQLCSVWSPTMIHEYKLPETESAFYVIHAKKLV